jgi:hypothetical protein
MYSCAVEVEVEDKNGQRLVESSMHFRTMNVREAKPFGPVTTNEPVGGMSPAQIRGSILLANWLFQGVQIARNRAHCQSLPT